MARTELNEALRSGVRALLMSPLLAASDPAFAPVRRHAAVLRDWFQRETGWVLTVDRDWARLYKRPATLDDASRGWPQFDRRRYVLFCLVCALLDRSEAQTTLHELGERLLQAAADPALADSGFAFGLKTQTERRELVAVCRHLLALGVLQLVAGDEDRFVTDAAGAGDALYDIHRRPLAALLAAVRGPSTWPEEDAPTSLPARLASLVDEHVTDSDEGRRTALRHHLARRLLDDPVVYLASLGDEARAYFINQRGPLAARLGEGSGLLAEQRAEGLALVDDSGELTDLAMPADGTDAHVTLITAALLAERPPDDGPLRDEDVADHLRSVRDRLGRFWRKSAREPGSESELAAIALDRLGRLQLIRRDERGIWPLPALARFALGEADVVGLRGSARAARPGAAAGASADTTSGTSSGAVIGTSTSPTTSPRPSSSPPPATDGHAPAGKPPGSTLDLF